MTSHNFGHFLTPALCFRILDLTRDYDVIYGRPKTFKRNISHIAWSKVRWRLTNQCPSQSKFGCYLISKTKTKKRPSLLKWPAKGGVITTPSLQSVGFEILFPFFCSKKQQQRQLPICFNASRFHCFSLNVWLSLFLFDFPSLSISIRSYLFSFFVFLF